MKLWEILLSFAIFAAALWYLYRRIIVTRGCSCGKSGCGPAKDIFSPADIKKMDDDQQKEDGKQ